MPSQVNVSRGRPGLIRSILGAAAVCGVAAGALQGVAQADELRGIRAFVSVDQRFEFADNRSLSDPADGTSARSLTSIGLRIQSETRLEQFLFDTGTTLSLGRDPGVTNRSRFSDPRLRLSYTREGADSLFSASGNIRRSRVDFTRPLTDFLDEEGELVLPEDFEDLIGTGRRLTYNAETRLEFGREAAPFGLAMRAGVSGIDYSAPTLADVRRHNIGATARMRVSPVTDLTVSADHSRFRREDIADTDRRTNALSFGVTHDLDPVTQISGAIGYTRISTREFGFTTRSSGTTGQLGLARILPDGVVSARAQQARSPDGGSRANLVLAREWERPTGALAGSVGATRSPGGDVNLIGSLDLRRDTPDGVVVAGLQRSVSVDADDNERLRTTINLRYTHEVNALSRFTLRAAHAHSAGTPTATRVSRTDLSATYSRDLTRDWSLNTGVSYRLRSTGAGARATSPVVFVGLGSTFAFGL